MLGKFEIEQQRCHLLRLSERLGLGLKQINFALAGRELVRVYDGIIVFVALCTIPSQQINLLLLEQSTNFFPLRHS